MNEKKNKKKSNTRRYSVLPSLVLCENGTFADRVLEKHPRQLGRRRFLRQREIPFCSPSRAPVMLFLFSSVIF